MPLTKDQKKHIEDGMALCDAVLKSISEELGGKQIEPNDLGHILPATMLMRSLDIYAAIKSCTDIYKGSPALILCRTLSESTVYLKGFSEDSKFKFEFLNKNNKEKIERLIKVKRDLPNTGMTLTVENVSHLTKKTEEQLLTDYDSASGMYSLLFLTPI